MSFRREHAVSGITTLTAPSFSAHISAAVEAATIAAAAFVETAPPAEPGPLFSLRHLSRSLLMRAVARLLIKLAVLLPLPRELQAAAALWPVSILWALVPTEEVDQDERPTSNQKSETASQCRAACGSTDPIRSVRFVSLADVTNPKVIGRIEGIGGRLAIGENGILLGTASLGFGLTGTPVDKLAGVRTATLQQMAYFRSVTEPVQVIDGKSQVRVDMNVGLAPADFEVKTAEVDILSEGSIVASVPLTFNSPGHAELPKDFAFDVNLNYNAEIVINRGIAGEELRRVKALRPVELALLGTKKVDVTENGRTRPMDVIKLYDARPTVEVNPMTASGGLGTTFSGLVRDSLAPVKKFFVNGLPAELTQRTPQNDAVRGEVGPFEAEFAVHFEPIVTSLSVGGALSTIWDRLFHPVPDDTVAYGPEGTVAAATAVNALGNVGWNSAVLSPNPEPDGSISGGDGSTTGLGIVLGQAVPESAPREEYQFTVRVKDRGLSRPGQQVCWPVKVKTNIEEKIVHTVWSLDGCQSRTLYLVPESFTVPTGLEPKLAEDLAKTRIRGKLGTRISLSYVGDSTTLDAMVMGAELVDKDGNAQKFVPSALGAPVVTIAGVTPYATPGDASQNIASGWAATVHGTVRDPIASALPSLPPTVTVNGRTGQVSDQGGGVFGFNITGVRLQPQIRVNARAESANGAVGYDYRDVVLNYADDGLVANGAQVLARDSAPAPTLDVLKPLYVNVYAPPMDVSQISGNMRGNYSMSSTGTGPWRWSGQLPPEIPLTFKDTGIVRTGGIKVYRSNESAVPVKVPSHQLRNPVTPPTFAQSLRLLAVEVGGFVEAQVNAGTAGALRGLADVSGLEVVTPREGSIVNASGSLLPTTTNPFGEGKAPALGVTLKWRGLSAPPALAATSPDADSGVANMTALLARAPLESTTVTVPFISALGESIVSGIGFDTSGRAYKAEAGSFTYAQEMVANDSGIGPFDATDVAGMRVAPGVYYNPSLNDGLDLFIPLGRSDVEVSEHLRKNSLRSVAMKRNGGSLLTVNRADGRSAASEGLVAPLANIPPTSAIAGNVPLAEQIMDGNDVTWQDIIDAGYQQDWNGSFTAAPGEFKLFDVERRSVILQRVREHNGLPQRAGGMSTEYQAYFDGWIKEIGIQASLALMFEAPALIRGTVRNGAAGLEWLVGATDRFFVRILNRSMGDALVTETIWKAGIRNQYEIMFPVLQAPRYMPMSAAVRTDPLIQVLIQQRNDGKALMKTTAYESTGRKAAHRMIVGAAEELGVLGMQDYAVGTYGQQAAVRLLPSTLPKAGGAATGIFDEVFELVITDGSGNVTASKIFIAEAKGGMRYFNILSKKNGRFVKLLDNREVYAIQGSREYIEGVAVEMAKDTNPIPVQQAGLKVLAKIEGNAWNEIEYAFVSSKWLMKGDQVVGVNPTMRVTKALLQTGGQP